MQRRPPRRPNARRRPQRASLAPAAAVNGGAPAERALPTEVVQLAPSLTVKEFAESIGVSAATVIRELLQNGVIASINQTIDFDAMSVVASDIGIEIREMQVEAREAMAEATEDRPEDLVQRPPVVTVMGHVDHGKTSLLDAIRKTRVTAGEVGGITQHIGAYQVEVHGQPVTFLDTPGHEAFTAMRARGARATDIAVLVVAADDGVMPQTREAADHARAAGVPVIVAMNKIDRPDADPQRVKQQLTELGLVVEDYGGDIVSVPVSARTGEGLETLLEMILFVAEMGNYRANPHRAAAGTVIEAKLDKARGPVATVLVENGMLNVGEVIVAGSHFGRTKALFNDKGKRVRQADPATPVEVLGLDGVPEAGDRFQVVPDERTARSLAAAGRRSAEARAHGGAREASLDAIMEGIRTGTLKELNLIVKADVRGSLEAITGAIQTVAESEAIQKEVRTKIVHSDTGNVTESDVMLAAATKGIVIAFNVRTEPGARRAADSQGIDIRTHNVIYHLTEDLEHLLSGMLEPEYAEVVRGEATVRQVFKIGRTHAAAGCYVTSGAIPRNAQARVLRDGELVHQGRIESLRRFKEDAREVQAGYECGITIVRFANFQEGDVIQAFSQEAVS
ncbi:MAG: translation initiation factor IF-2 [Chloroflexi bacterium]|nr:translation initiation factor IF-2 [Chloroflexota bacterium]